MMTTVVLVVHQIAGRRWSDGDAPADREHGARVETSHRPGRDLEYPTIARNVRVDPVESLQGTREYEEERQFLPPH